MIRGINPSDIPYTLTEKLIRIVDPEARVRSLPSFQAYHERQGFLMGGTDYFTWDRSHRDIPIEILLEAFTMDELLRIHADDCIQSTISEWVQKKHFLLWKIENCMWQFDPGKRDPRRVAWGVKGLKKLSVEMPDFEVTITHTMFYHRWGLSEHVDDLWIDAPFAALIHYRGEHVLTCGFMIRDREVFLSQVQLRKKTGNRFLFKLKTHVLDFAVDLLTRAFGPCIGVTGGASAVEAIRRAYGKMPCKMTPEDETRIATLYDRPLEHFTRVGEPIEVQGREFRRLEPKAAARPLPAPKGRRPKLGRADSAHPGHAQ